MVERQSEPLHIAGENVDTHIRNLQGQEEFGKQGEREAKVFLEEKARLIYKAGFDELNETQKQALRGAQEASVLGFEEFILRRRMQYGPRLTNS